MTRPRRSVARSVPRHPPRRSSWRSVLLVSLLLGLLATSVGYWHYRRQINRYARRAWATFTANSLTGHEKTPLLDGYTVHGIDVSYYQGKIDWRQVARHNV